MEQVGVKVEVQLDESGFVEFAIAGSAISGEFWCAECRYGAVVQRVLPHCPMCGGTVWESRGSLGSRRLGD